MPALEDRALFERAWAQGLIQTRGDQRLAVAGRDEFLIEAGVATPGLSVGDCDAARRSLKALHHSANGDYVLGHVEAATQTRFWLAMPLGQGAARVQDEQAANW